jgi:hypothetical protein
MNKNLVLVSLVFLLLSFKCFSQQHKPLIVELISGYNNATISKGMKGFYFQTSIKKDFLPYLSFRLALGMTRSNDFPSTFDGECIPFDANDPACLNNKFQQDLWNLVKNLDVFQVRQFGLTEVTNSYLGFNTDVRFLKISRMSLWGSLGANLQNTFGSTLYLYESSFINNKLNKFIPGTIYNTQNVISYNLGCRIKFEINNSTSLLLNGEKFFGDNGKGNFSKAEFINLGVGITKKLHF